MDPSTSRPLMTDIPELLSALSPHLVSHDLYNCIRVNKAWFTSLLPHLWATVCVVDFDSISQSKSRKQRYYPLDTNSDRTLALRTYGHLIRSLTVGLARSLRQLGPSLISLRELHFNMFMLGSPQQHPALPQYWLQQETMCNPQGSTAILVSLFEQNMHTLMTVTLSIVHEDNMDALIEGLQRLLSLEELIIYDAALFLRQEHYLDRLVEACAARTSLKRLACCSGTGTGDTDEFPALDVYRATRNQDTLERIRTDHIEQAETHASRRKRIQQLRLSIPQGNSVFGRDHLGRTFRGCGSALESVQFVSFPDAKVEFLLDVVQECCTNLRYLSFRTSIGAAQNHSLWVRLVDACPPLESLTIYNGIDAMSLVAVLQRRHAVSLRQLRFYNQHCPYEQSSFLDVLRFCPHLQEFVCRWLVRSTYQVFNDTTTLVLPSKEDNDDDRTWACRTTLRRLTLCIGTLLRDHDQVLMQREVMRHILRHAEKLSYLTLTLAPSSYSIWTPTTIVWDEGILQEEHQALGYSKSMKCFMGTDKDLVLDFEH